MNASLRWTLVAFVVRPIDSSVMPLMVCRIDASRAKNPSMSAGVVVSAALLFAMGVREVREVPRMLLRR